MHDAPGGVIPLVEKRDAYPVTGGRARRATVRQGPDPVGSNPPGDRGTGSSRMGNRRLSIAPGLTRQMPLAPCGRRRGSTVRI